VTDLAWIAADLRPLARPIASLTEDPKKCAAAIFALIGKDEKKAACAASPEGRA